MTVSRNLYLSGRHHKSLSKISFEIYCTKKFNHLHYIFLLKSTASDSGHFHFLIKNNPDENMPRYTIEARIEDNSSESKLLGIQVDIDLKNRGKYSEEQN